MSRIIAIVEGDGEVRAVPALMRRLAYAAGRYDVEILPPIRVHRDKFLNKSEEFGRMLTLAVAKVRTGTVFVLLDADDDCPVDLARRIRDDAQSHVHDAHLAVIIANREFESWFIAAAESIAGTRGLIGGLAAPAHSEEIRNAKGWLSERCRNGRYREVTDQPALVELFDIDAALAKSRSFRKFFEEYQRALAQLRA